MNLFRLLPFYELWRPPSLTVMIERELADAHRARLEAHSAQEYATAVVEYNNARIARLEVALRVAVSPDLFASVDNKGKHGSGLSYMPNQDRRSITGGVKGL